MLNFGRTDDHLPFLLDVGPYPAFYRFGSCIVGTSLPLQALTPVTLHDELDLVGIDWTAHSPTPDTQWSHHWRDGEEVVLSLARQGADYWMRFPGFADFLLQLEPCRILIAPGASSLDHATLEHLLVDQVLPRLLAQRGELLVHASALAIAGRHALFTAPSGWGKSILAGLLLRHGHAVLSDDCVQLKPTGERFNAIPTYPSLRLYPSAVDQLFPGLVGSTPVASYSTKLRVPVETPQESDLTFSADAVYLLGGFIRSGGSINITPLLPAETCQALLRHSFRLDLNDRAANAHQFALCSAVARAVPAFRLDYPWGPAHAAELALHITDHLTGLPGRY